MNILAIGDIFGGCGIEHVSMVLKGIKEDEQIDFCVANAENASGNGITISDYDRLTDAEIDAFTLGNHAFGKKEVVHLLERESNIVRPLNYPNGTPGKGSMVLSCKDKKIGIINALGQTNMSPVLNCPFEAVREEINRIREQCDLILVDFHAEATSEKKAMGFFLSGKVACVYGTHTHVQTADETVFSSGTGYITDIGMTGAVDSILGIDKEIIINRFVTAMPQRFEHAHGRAELCGIVICIDDNTMKCKQIKRIKVR